MKKTLFFLIFISLGFTSDFETCMGKDGPSWHFLQQRRDTDFLEKCKQIYEEILPTLSETSTKIRIPHTVHFIWLGPKGFPPASVENVRSWIAMHPDWKVKFWTDRPRRVPCSAMEVCYVQDFPFSKLKEYYEEAQNWGQKSDILRLEILYLEGGVYIDHDTECLRPFTSLHAGCDFYAGLASPHEPHGGYPLTVNNGILGSIPAHPLIERTIDILAERWRTVSHNTSLKQEIIVFEETISRTYLPLTLALYEQIDQAAHSNLVLPTQYFYAKEKQNSLYTYHQFAASWLDRPTKNSENGKIIRMGKDQKRLASWSTLAFLISGCLFVTSFSFYFSGRKP